MRKDSIQSSTTSDSHGSNAPLCDRQRSVSPPLIRTEHSPTPTIKAEDPPMSPGKKFRFFRPGSPGGNNSPLPSPDKPGFPRVQSLTTCTAAMDDNETGRKRATSISGTLTRTTSEPRRSLSASHAGSPPRRSTTPVPPVHTPLPSVPTGLNNGPSISNAITTPTQPVARNWFLQLLSQLDSPSTPGVPDPPPVSLPRHRKGDVDCLSYRTLDDRDMRKLDGRSDHRPVIGVYAVYV